MEALTISAANLDIIEKNLGDVANELSGVINNVDSVNTQVNKVEEKVATLNDEVRNLVKEIRETTTITNARQNIMYNNEQIEKKYGYFDKVRRTTESLLDAIINSSLSKSSLLNLKQDLIMNNPNYWLSNALSATICWILDDKENAYKEVNNSLKKDYEKTSIYFSLINLKLGRKDASIKWLNTYLNRLDPLNLNNEFVSILDLVSNGLYGFEGKQIIINKINEWLKIIMQNNAIMSEEIQFMNDFIKSKEELKYNFPFINQLSQDANVINNNLLVSSSYENVLSYFKFITESEEKEKTIDNVISNLIYEYEEKEQIFQKDNFKNRLIIECNGNREEADRLYKKQQQIYNSNANLLTLLRNILIYKNEYKVSNKTQKFALSLIKNNILLSIDNVSKNIIDSPINIKVNDFITRTNDGLNKKDIDKEIESYLNKKYSLSNRFLITLLISINIVGIIGIFITLESFFSSIIGVIVLLSDIYLIFKIIDDTKVTKNEKLKEKQILDSSVERVLAETIDYKNIMKSDNEEKEKLKGFLNSITLDNYIKSNERNLNIGDLNGR